PAEARATRALADTKQATADRAYDDPPRGAGVLAPAGTPPGAQRDGEPRRPAWRGPRGPPARAPPRHPRRPPARPPPPPPPCRSPARDPRRPGSPPAVAW